MKLLTALFAIAIGLICSAREADGQTNAYDIEFLDRAGEPLANATVFTEEF